MNALLLHSTIIYYLSLPSIRAQNTLKLAREYIFADFGNGCGIAGGEFELGGMKGNIFKGIPYAEPPTGENRFKNPVPISDEHYRTGYIAKKYGSACYQFMDYVENDRYSYDSMKRQSEDCLYLNIYSPGVLKPVVPYPVIVWIHGGSLLAGSGDTGMDEEVVLKNFVFHKYIVISINYRLGPLGFLTSQDPENLGNYGLYDQLEALKWINKYIFAFGGDKDSVTIMGESAGGASVSILAMSPITKGLVHKAIVMSGSAAANWAIETRSESDWNLPHLMAYLSCRVTFSPDELNETFENLSLLNSMKDYPCPLVKNPIKCPITLTLKEKWDCFRKQSDFSNKLFRKAITMQLGLSKVVVDKNLIPADINTLLADYPRIPIMTGVAHLEWGHKQDIFYGFETELINVAKDVQLEKIRTIIMSNFQNADESAYTNSTIDLIANNLVLDKFYGFETELVNVTKDVQLEKIRTIIESNFQNADESAYTNSTIDLIANATYQHYIGAQYSPQKIWDLPSFTTLLREIESDAEFVAPCAKEAMAYVHKNISVYLYSFDHVPKVPVTEAECKVNTVMNITVPANECVVEKRVKVYERAFHGLDHAYLFTEGYSSNQYFKYDADAYKMAALFTGLIRNFSRFGNPTPAGSPVIWQSYSASKPSYMRLKVPLLVVNDTFNWFGSIFWNSYIKYVSGFSKEILGPEKENILARLAREERDQLAAYKRAWWALWILVAAIAVVLWTAVICMVARKCMRSNPSKAYKNVLLAEPM